MVRLVKFLKGYVQIRVWGDSPERFMNLCGNHDILLWNIVNHGDYYTMCVSVKGFFRLKSCLKKTRTRAAVEKRVGLPFYLPRVRKRKIFGLGLFGCFFFLFFMSRFLWAIEIEGNQAVTDDVFWDFLAQKGIHAGIPRNRISGQVLEEQIREEFDLVTWASVQVDGTRLCIRVKENEHPGKTEKEIREVGTDLCAQEDGVIVKMITRNGVPLKKPGDAVKKGEILVQGQVPIYNEDATVREIRYCNADADIYIRYTYPVSEKLAKSYTAKEYTGRMKKRYFIRTIQKEYRIAKKEPYLYCDSLMEEEQVHLFGSLYLPLFTGRVTYREYLPTELKYSDEEAAERLKERLSRLVCGLEEKGVQIIQKDVKIVADKKNYFLKGNFTVISGAAVSVPTEKTVEEADGTIYDDG